MQISSLLLAFALSSATLVAGQAFPSQGGFPLDPGPFETPSASGFTAPVVVTATLFPATNDTGVSDSNQGISTGAVVGAAVGASLGASLVLLACTLFLLRYRTRKTMVIAVQGAHNEELGIRCAALESDVRALYEQLDRMEAQRLAVGGIAMLHSDEKDLEAFGAGGYIKETKEHPPTYAD
ncbi:hypothetical protein DFH06DRAFT_1196344 [Mycena polygramma]|nr:hypothetical protein DFH06DRAFT_1196344 [Mycena polygramma]